MTIERRAIAGVTSEGMLCSEQELGLTEDSAGILVLRREPPSQARSSSRRSRPRATRSSRSVSARIAPTGLVTSASHAKWRRSSVSPSCRPSVEAPARVAAGTTIDALVKVTVEDAERCPHYGANAVVDIAIAPSPLWLRYRLSSLGVRPISNVVDITNIVMLEYGHPMHVFDLDLVRGGRIVVRRAREAEPMTTLDGVARKLSADDLVITDGEGPVALAGVMGAANSEIRAETKRVLFECAYFNPRGIRRASRRHGLHTESSHRFERGVDPGDVEAVLARAASLATQLASGGAVPGMIHARTKPIERRTVTLRASRLAQILGVDVPWKDSVATLERLGCEMRETRETRETQKRDDAIGDFLVPTHRPDISREIDLIEEVARVRGFDSNPGRPPRHPPHPRRGDARGPDVPRARGRSGPGALRGRDVRVPRRSDARQVGAPAPAVRVKNPLNENHAVMRTSLLPGLLRSIDLAARRGERDARLFTVGSVFLGGGGNRELPEERASLRRSSRVSARRGSRKPEDSGRVGRERDRHGGRSAPREPRAKRARLRRRPPRAPASARRRGNLGRGACRRALRFAPPGRARRSRARNHGGHRRRRARISPSSRRTWGAPPRSIARSHASRRARAISR